MANLTGVRVAADDLGESRQPAIRPISKKIQPLLVKPFATAMKKTTPQSRKKLVDTYFGKMQIKSQSAKVKKEMREILVAALKKDVGWLEFVANQLIDGCDKEITEILLNPKEARTAGRYDPYDEDILHDKALELAAKDGWQSDGMDTIAYSNPQTGETSTEAEVIYMYLKQVPGYKTKRTSMNKNASGEYKDMYDLSNVKYPLTLNVSGGQNDSLYRLHKVLRDNGWDEPKAVEIDEEQDLIDILVELEAEAEDWEAEQLDQLQSDSESEEDPEEWYDDNYADYTSDKDEPAEILMSAVNSVSRTAKTKSKHAAYNANSMYSGFYPEMSDIEALDLTYPYTLEVPYSGPGSASVRAEAKKLGIMSDDSVVFNSADDVYDLFSALDQKAYNTTKIWQSENDDQPDGDLHHDLDEAHIPGTFLAAELGFDVG